MSDFTITATQLRKIAKPYVDMLAAADAIEEIGVIKNHLEELKIARKGLIDEIAGSRSELSNIQEEIKATSVRGESIISDAKQASENMIISTEKQIKEMIEAGKKKAFEAGDSLLNEHKTDLDTVKKQVSRSRSDIKKFTQELNDLTAAVEAKTQEYAEIEAKLIALKESVKTL